MGTLSLSPSKKINERDFYDAHSDFFASASCFDEDLSSTGPSFQFQASLNSPRATDVRKNERMQAGLEHQQIQILEIWTMRH